MTTGAMQLRHLDTGAVLLRFAQPVAQLTMNQRHHWSRQRATARAWRTSAGYVAQALQLGQQPAALVTVRLDAPAGARGADDGADHWVIPLSLGDGRAHGAPCGAGLAPA